VHWYSAVIPIGVLIFFSIKKAPALLGLAAGIISAIVVSFFHNPLPIGDLLEMLFGGFVSNTGIGDIDELLTRGGMADMFFTIGIVLLALSLGGLLFTLGIVPKLLSAIEASLKKVRSVIFATALTAIGINVLIGEQYLSILLTAETYQSQ